MLSLPVLGGALGSPGRARGPDVMVAPGREGQVGRVRPELGLQVVTMVMAMVLAMVVVVVGPTVDLDRASG